jgi:hypothetical protein
MLSLIFVTVCGLCEWKRICVWFVSFFLNMYCRLRSSYQEGSVGIPITCFNPPQFCACPMPRSWFPTSHVMVFCVQLRWKMIVHFVDIGGIDYHHCLNFLFIIQNLKVWILSSWLIDWLIDWLVFNANFSNISAISWREQILS